MDPLYEMLARQRELMPRFEEIERENGFWVPSEAPMGLQHPFAQARCKDFAWRITEELVESAVELRNGELSGARDEMVDAMHFMLELLLLVGISAADFPGGLAEAFRGTKDRHWSDTVLVLGDAMHMLRNRPWKRSVEYLDEGVFRGRLLEAFSALIGYARYLGMEPEELYTRYLEKNTENHRRSSNG